MNMLESLFDWLLATTLRASVLVVVIASVQLLLRRWLPPQWRYALWLPMLLVLALPVLPTVPFGILPKKTPAIVTTPQVAAPTQSEVATPLPQAPAAPTSLPKSVQLNPWALLWLSGSAAVLAMGILSYRRSMRRITKHAVAADGSLLRSIEHAAREVGLGKVPRVIVSPEVESPAVTGLIRPSLLLPAGFPESFNEAEARLILLHELTHLKRLDLPVNGLCCIFQSLHWFNPLLWFAFARMRADRESACDAQVLSLDETDSRSAYGHALLKLQSSGFSSGLQLGFVGIFERSAGLKSRIREISAHRAAHPAWRAGGTGMISLLVVFGATKAQDQQAAQPGGSPEPKVIVDGKDPAPSAGVTYIQRKLDTIIEPVVKAENTTLPELIDFLRNRSVELDTNEPNPSRKGVNFVIRQPRNAAAAPAPGDAVPPQAMVLSLDLKKVSLRQAFDAVCKETGLVYKVDDFAVTFVPAGEKDDPLVRPAPPQGPGLSAKTLNAIRQIVIPVVDIEDASLAETVEFFNAQAKERANGAAVPLIGLDPKVNGETRIKELRLRNVPLSDALKYCAEASRTVLISDDTGIRFRKP